MSTLRTNTIGNVAGTQSTDVLNVINGSAKAWVNFNGTGTVAIRASYNVSSITDNGTGDYTVNFAAAFTDTNYVTLFSGADALNGSTGPRIATSGGFNGSLLLYSTTQVRLGSNFADHTLINVAAFR